MIYKVADGDVLKILPIPRKNGKFDLCRVTSCAFMDNKMIYDTLKAINWIEESFKSTNSALNLRFSVIEEALIKKGIKN